MRKKYIIISIATAVLIVIILSKTPVFNPQPKEIKTVQVDGKYNYGKRVYEKYCVSCHDAKMIEYATAPPLGGITKRRDKKWLYDYTRNSSKMYADGDPIAVKLRAENFGLMPSFPMLNDEKLEAVFYYIEKEYAKNKSQKTD